MLKRSVAVMAILALCTLGTAGVAQAHECEYTEDVNGDGTVDREEGPPSNCRETDVQPNWRDGNYVPLFDLEDRDDEEQRRQAQRWRDCSYYLEDGSYENNQFCVWADFGNSISGSPNEIHVGSGGQHCFLAEAAHDCTDHDTRRGEGVHDAHGGSVYVDVCAAESTEGSYCDEGTADTQVGATVMDHNPCGAIVPVVACTDEYHVIRPFDEGYTEAQMADSVEYIGRILADPMVYLCGKPGYPSYGFPPCGGGGGGAGVTPVPVSDLDPAIQAELARRAAIGDGSAATIAASRDGLATRTLAATGSGSSRDAHDASVWGAAVLAMLALAVRTRKLVHAR